MIWKGFSKSGSLFVLCKSRTYYLNSRFVCLTNKTIDNLCNTCQNLQAGLNTGFWIFENRLSAVPKIFPQIRIPQSPNPQSAVPRGKIGVDNVNPVFARV
jgi:hypothetical protein